MKVSVITWKDFDDVKKKDFTSPEQAIKHYLTQHNKYPCMVSIKADLKNSNEFVKWCKDNEEKVKKLVYDEKINKSLKPDIFMKNMKRIRTDPYIVDHPENGIVGEIYPFAVG